MVSGPRRVDPHQLAKDQESTLDRYRRSFRHFVAWLVERGFVPHGPEAWDDLLVEWKNDTRPSKANFEAAVAAAQFVFPQFRSHMAWCRAVIAGWAIAHVRWS